MKNQSITFKIAFTGIMLSLVILFQFLENFMPFGDFGGVKFNFSIVFIFATAFIAGMPWAFVLLVLRFAIGPAMNGGYASETILLGHIVLLLVGLMTLSSYWVVAKVFKIDTFMKYLIVAILITLLISFVMSLLNALLFTRMFFVSFNNSWDIPAFAQTYSLYEDGGKIMYFGIPNYWAGNIAVYTTFNIINLSVCFVFYYPLSKVVRRFSVSTHTN